MRYCQNNKEAVLKALESGTIEDIVASYPNLIDDIIYEMLDMGLISSAGESFKDKE